MTVVDASQLFGTLPKWGKILFEVKFKMSTLGYVSSGLTWLCDQCSGPVVLTGTGRMEGY